MSVSIFDITMIVDRIGYSLPLADIRSCRRVNRHFSSMFKPHLWRHQTLDAIIPTLSDEVIAGLLDHKRWIRSLTVGAPHIERVSTLGFTQLQELVLYDKNFQYAIEGERVPLHVIDSLLDNNKNLQSLEIDLDRYQYDTTEPYPFSLTLMLAIARHPTLKRLVWKVPQGHADNSFVQYLLAVCLQRQIQELHVEPRRHYLWNCRMCKGGCEDDYGCNRGFSKFIEVLRGNPQLEELENWLHVSIEDLDMTFAFEKLSLEFGFQADIHHVVNRSPYLREIRLEQWSEVTRDAVFDSLANCSTLRTLDLSQTRSDPLHRFDASWFERLQTLRLPRFSGWALRDVLLAFPHTSRNTLEVLEMGGGIPPVDIIDLFENFPNLKQLSINTIRIFVQEDMRSGPEPYTPGADESTMEACIAQGYDPRVGYFPSSMSEWWNDWIKAKDLIRDISAAYLERRQRSSLRPIYMQFVLPIKVSMSEKETKAYVNGTDAWVGSERRAVTLEDVRRMMDDEEKEKERLMAEYKAEEEERNQRFKRRRYATERARGRGRFSQQKVRRD